MGDVTVKLIQPLARQFTLPKGATDDIVGWRKDYQVICGTFGDEILERATALIMASRQKTTFPLPSECNRACLDALEMLTLQERLAHRPNNAREIRNEPFDRRYPEWSDRRRDLADRLIQCELGKQALREDWIWTLWEFCRLNERLPDKHEAERVRGKGIARSKEFWETVGMDPESDDRAKRSMYALPLVKWREKVVLRLKNLVEA
jgi:hypothetical protein